MLIARQTERNDFLPTSWSSMKLFHQASTCSPAFLRSSLMRISARVRGLMLIFRLERRIVQLLKLATFTPIPLAWMAQMGPLRCSDWHKGLEHVWSKSVTLVCSRGIWVSRALKPRSHWHASL